jgi:hypothetical protein
MTRNCNIRLIFAGNGNIVWAINMANKAGSGVNVNIESLSWIYWGLKTTRSKLIPEDTTAITVQLIHAVMERQHWVVNEIDVSIWDGNKVMLRYRKSNTAIDESTHIDPNGLECHKS